MIGLERRLEYLRELFRVFFLKKNKRRVMPGRAGGRGCSSIWEVVKAPGRANLITRNKGYTNRKGDLEKSRDIVLSVKEREVRV